MNLAEAGHILRLTDVQLAAVRRAAAPLRPATRDKYLRLIASELAEAKRVDDAKEELRRKVEYMRLSNQIVYLSSAKHA